jgi:hypothetical protein
MFIEEATIAPLTVQDCQVSDWANPDGALRLGSGPVVLFDCVFTRPPNRLAPIVPGHQQPLIVSNNRSADTDGIVRSGLSTNVTEIPAGHFGGCLTSPQQTFFRDTARIAGKVLDVKRDFGAKGDGQADDTAALQAAIDAAQKHGRQALAYVPSGEYRVTKSLEVTGRDWRLGGSGTHSRLLWHGPDGGTVMRVHDPDGVTIENLDIGNGGTKKQAIDILQTGSGAPARMNYERVWVFGMYQKQASVKGLHCQDLPAGTVIVADHFNGNLTFTNCALAQLLFNTSFEGAIVVEGRDPRREGLLGFMTRLATINTNGLCVKDSQNVVMSDYYVESADRMMEFYGNAGDPMGRVTIQMPKSHCSQNPVIQVRNYRGCVALGPTMFYPGGVKPALITQQGGNPCDVILMACQAYEVTPTFELGDKGALTLLGNTGTGMGSNRVSDGGLREVAASLDDLRRLGALDLELNYPSR